MRATGVVRKVDELGRVVIPIELRRSMQLNNGDAVEIYVDSDVIIFEKFSPDSTGYSRKIDELGRVVIPMEVRRSMGIGDKDPLEIFVSGKKIAFKKYAPGCIFCDSIDNVSYFKGKLVCSSCTKDIAAMSGKGGVALGS